jgi:phosphohistidine phosphatase
MELLIVRHAIAFERNDKRWPDDGDRPLSPRGVTRARSAAAGLRRMTERPTRVLTSPLERARQTAAILTAQAGWPRAVESALLLPGSSPEALLGALARLRERRIAVVGHQPDLGRLLAACLAGNAGSGAFELRKMGVALVAFPAVARGGRGELRWLVPPRLLRAARMPARLPNGP